MFGSAAENRWRFRFTGIFVVLGFLVALGACSPREPASGYRLIDETPGDLLDASTAVDEFLIFEYSFSEQADLERWESAGFDNLFQIRKGRLFLKWSNPSPKLTGTVAFDAKAVDEIRVTGTGSKLGKMRLFWADLERGFSGERFSTELTTGNVGGQEDHVFPVGSHPLWTGRIQRLMLVPSGVGGQTAQVEKISGYWSKSNLTGLENIGSRAWKVEAEHEQRSAVVTPQGRSIEYPLEIPEGAELRVSTAIIDTNLVRLRPAPSASDESERGQVNAYFRLAGEEKRRPLISTHVDPGSRWNDHVVDLRQFAGRAGSLIFEAEASKEAELRPRLVAWANPEIVVSEAPTQRPNIILISLDTLRADRLSLNGYGRSTSPNIDEWAKTWGVNFPNTIASAPWTLPSHVSILSGLDSIRHGVDHGLTAPPTLTLLPEILRMVGYSTFAVTGGGLMHPVNGFNQGFDAYWFWDKAPGTEGWGMDIEAGLERAGRILKENSKRPFFLFFHTYEIHGPYAPRQPFYENFGGRLQEAIQFAHASRVQGPELHRGILERWKLRFRPVKGATVPDLSDEEAFALVSDLYDSGIAYADDKLSELLAELEILGTKRPTLVVLTSDHGESLGEHGLATHCSLYDDTLKVPLVISFPGKIDGGRQIDAQVRLIDLFPTILDLSGLEVPTDIDGVSLAPLIAGDASAAPPASWSYAMHQGVSVREANQSKYILYNHPWSPMAGAEEYFDLERDPAEVENLVGQDRFEPVSQRAHTVERLKERPGIRVEIVNASGEPLVGTIESRGLVRRQLVRCLFSCDGVSWAGPRRLEFAIVPGRTCSLLLEAQSGGMLKVAGGIGAIGEPGFELNVDLRERIVKTGVSRVNGEWRDGVWDSAGGGTGILVAAQGSGSDDLKAAEKDEELLRQLQALGYVE